MIQQEMKKNVLPFKKKKVFLLVKILLLLVAVEFMLDWVAMDRKSSASKLLVCGLNLYGQLKWVNKILGTTKTPFREIFGRQKSVFSKM